MVEKDLSEKYAKFYKNDFGKKILEKELEFVNLKLGDCENILSIGCGPAFLEAKLQQINPEKKIIGVDSSMEMIKQAPKTVSISYGDGQNLMFKDSSIDCILYLTSLEFIDDYKRALEESRRVLGENGKILLLLLNPRSYYFREKYRNPDSYVRRMIKHTDTAKIKKAFSKYFLIVDEGYCLGILDDKIFDSNDPRLASLYFLEGVKHGK